MSGNNLSFLLTGLCQRFTLMAAVIVRKNGRLAGKILLKDQNEDPYEFDVETHRLTPVIETKKESRK